MGVGVKVGFGNYGLILGSYSAYFRVILGLYGGYMGIMEKDMETTKMGCIGALGKYLRHA